MIFSDLAGIIADDLTGANDTALQFQQRGASTKILLDSDCTPKVKAGTEVWALSSESRNVPAEEAKEIEAKLEYPGHIKVNVIRESRFSDTAK